LSRCLSEDIDAGDGLGFACIYINAKWWIE